MTPGPMFLFILLVCLMILITLSVVLIIVWKPSRSCDICKRRIYDGEVRRITYENWKIVSHFCMDCSDSNFERKRE